MKFTIDITLKDLVCTKWISSVYCVWMLILAYLCLDHDALVDSLLIMIKNVMVNINQPSTKELMMDVFNCDNKKVLVGFNDLKTTHPKVVEEWGIENYLLGIGGPENYKYDSTKRAYWKCSNAVKDIRCQLMTTLSKVSVVMNHVGSALVEWKTY